MDIAHELTVPVLVAMVVALHGPDPRDDDFLNFASGINLPADLNTYHPFCRALDAIASLCVSRPREQGFSVGFQIDQRNSQLLASIADSQEVEQDTIDYLANLWAVLRKHSDWHAGNRPKSVYCSGVSSGIPQSQGATALSRELVELVYVFTRDRHMNRWHKWWDPVDGHGLLGFARKFQQKKGRYLEGTNRKFELLLCSLRIVVNCLREDRVDWGKVLGHMGLATDLSDGLLKGGDRGWCENLARDIAADTETPPFPVRRALEKLTSHHRHIRALISFSHSSRLRLAFSLRMSIYAVPPPNPPGYIHLPITTSSWQAHLEKVSADHGFHLCTHLAESLINSLLSNHNSPSVPHLVHSECALIAHYNHLRTSPGRYVPAFKYIGMSKPPCRPCYIWLSAFNNRRNGPRFCTRGTSGKWNFPWTPPVVEGLEATLVEQECVAYLRYKGVLISESPESMWEEDEEERAEQARWAEEALNEPF
ncbi:hypothetical protein Q9L58_007295 [Maublancomyces gigas]|uniref:Uncharacterized protein n=1 Tax=Discina gigas TaxID=1032678 RepID=A0ABR3GCX1_9PEZI